MPVRFECDHAVPLPRWDRMLAPVPGSTLRVHCGDPIRVTEESLPAAAAELTRALGPVP